MNAAAGQQWFIRRPIRQMPRNYRHFGLCAAEVAEKRELMALVGLLCAAIPAVPAGGNLRYVLLTTLVVVIQMLIRLLAVYGFAHLRVNPANNNRGFASFTEEECWDDLRFRKSDLPRFFRLTGFPDEVVTENGLRCPGEYAFALMLYRITYPTRLK